MIGLPDLRWFPKPFGAGDTDEAGSKKMLGKPDIDLPNLLVRETAQNSWDARLPGEVPRFELRLRILEEKTRDVLRWNVFRESSPNLGLDEALSAVVLRALEVSDRGTRGLGGPTRNDIEVPAGERSDYADFVLTTGAPSGQSLGGGTYGFGKTASYLASSCYTIVIWSRARQSDGEVTERFVASAMGPSFLLDGQRYTGRQWWGMPAGGSSSGSAFQLEPAVGQDARRLGEALFERSFDEDETGTSILILQPKGVEEPEQLVDEWAAAIRNNLWPKFDPQQAPHRRMQIALVSNGKQVCVLPTGTSFVLSAKQLCLQAIREIQAGRGQSNPLVRLETVECLRPKQLLGHLAMIRVLGNTDDDPMADTRDKVTLMRTDAELVVKAQPHGRTSDGMSRWVGVFKPIREVDQHFAQAEPPAHDTWTPEGLEDKRAKTFVRVALREINSKVEQFVNPVRVATNAEQASSTGALSAALAGLAGSARGSRATAPATSSRTRRGGGGRVKQPKVDIIHVTPLPFPADGSMAERQTTRVEMSLRDVKRATLRASSLAVAVDGGTMSSEGQVVLEGWRIGGGALQRSEEVEVAFGQTVWADISYPVGLAIEFNFAASEV